jgi:hypothetical protein
VFEIVYYHKEVIDYNGSRKRGYRRKKACDYINSISE